MPLLRELPGLPRRIFSSLTAFLGGIFRILPLAYVRTVTREREARRLKRKESMENSRAVLAAAARFKVGIAKEEEKSRVVQVGI